MNKTILFLFVFIAFSPRLQAQLQSPETFLGYSLGEQFTRHHQVMGYYRHVASEVPHVRFIEYGKTYEQRELTLLFISSPENMEKLETIRTDNLKRAGILEGTPELNIPIIWLSYNVHGNESVSTEAGMATTYELLTNRKEWLKEAMVVIDPCINPDGRERYVNFYWQYGNQPYDPDPQALELNEPWPRGRANHYLFDLNRDWAWQSQIESQHRIKQYNQWLPQIHVDFHEQGVNSPYYFAPAAKPYHELISPWQRDFQIALGKNHAKYFDQENWFYFTKQRFDLLYPSYGDTYPTYNGAIGMTYEQGGSGRAGLGVITLEGDTLTLKDRIAHHYTTGISTVEMGVKAKDKLLGEFEAFFKTGTENPSGRYKAFILKTSRDEDKRKDLMAWLDVQGIKYSNAEAGKKLSGFRYSNGRQESFTTESNDLLISTKQPKSVLAQVFFEPKTALEDSLTYDITAWSLPYAYGIEAYALQNVLGSGAQPVAGAFVANESPEDTYAFLLPWNNLKDARLLADLLKSDIKVRFSEEPFTYGGTAFERGTLVIAERDNEYVADFEAKVVALANQHERTLYPVATGFADNGPDLGSSDIVYLEKPSIALMFGEGTYSLDAGATWHFFEQQLGFPVTLLGLDYFNQVDLSPYDVLVMQSGSYSNLGSSDLGKIKDWVRNGGKLIAVQNALEVLQDNEIGSLSLFNSDEEKSKFESLDKKKKEDRETLAYADRARAYIQGEVPGAIFRTTIDNTHPLAFGYDNTYFSLKTDNLRYGYLDNGWNVGIIDGDDDLVSGFAGKFVRDKAPQSLVFGHESYGGGDIVYMVDNPLFRAFWYDGKLLFCNALFFVGQ